MRVRAGIKNGAALQCCQVPTFVAFVFRLAFFLDRPVSSGVFMMSGQVQVLIGGFGLRLLPFCCFVRKPCAHVAHRASLQVIVI